MCAGLGNVSPGVEFNFYMDPDAANLVLRRASESKTLVTLVPMETCFENDLGKVSVVKLLIPLQTFY